MTLAISKVALYRPSFSDRCPPLHPEIPSHGRVEGSLDCRGNLGDYHHCRYGTRTQAPAIHLHLISENFIHECTPLVGTVAPQPHRYTHSLQWHTALRNNTISKKVIGFILPRSYYLQNYRYRLYSSKKSVFLPPMHPQPPIGNKI